MRGMRQQIYSHYQCLPDMLLMVCEELLRKWPDNDNYIEAIRCGWYRHQLLRQLLQDAGTWKFEPFVLLVATRVILIFFPDEYEHDDCQTMNEFSYWVAGRGGECYMGLLLADDNLFEIFFEGCLEIKEEIDDDSRRPQVLDEYICASKQNNHDFMSYQCQVHYDGLKKLETLFPCGLFVRASLGLADLEGETTRDTSPTDLCQSTEPETYQLGRFTVTKLNSKKPENNKSDQISTDESLPKAPGSS